ncbi:unnamed protein product [Cochlearia groenlandica]
MIYRSREALVLLVTIGGALLWKEKDRQIYPQVELDSHGGKVRGILIAFRDKSFWFAVTSRRKLLELPMKEMEPSMRKCRREQRSRLIFHVYRHISEDVLAEKLASKGSVAERMNVRRDRCDLWEF